MASTTNANSVPYQATLVAPSGPAPLSDLSPLQLSDLNGKAYYIEIGASLAGDLPPNAGDPASGGGLQTGSQAQQKPTAPTFVVSMRNLASITSALDPSKFYVSWKIALDSAYIKRNTSLAPPNEPPSSSNPNREALTKQTIPVYLCSEELQNAGGAALTQRYFCRFGPDEQQGIGR